ncbi:MAG: sterol desaturase family protein [Cyanobacteria bacterium Co-bin13]|nr:sterol desaturase family protein [Cyanobacteria bacterium Co-bin13]
MAAHSFSYYGFFFLGLILIRYLLISGLTYCVFYLPPKQSFALRQGRRLPPTAASIQRDIGLSLLAAVVFALASALVMKAYEQGLTLLYIDVGQYGAWYLGISFFATLFLQDTYFYFLHRAFHHPKVFRWAHSGHHRSVISTPWTSFAFDLPEALTQALFFVAIVFILPLHLVTVLAILLTMTVWAVWNHLGFTITSSFFLSQWLGKWLIGPGHHGLHHRRHSQHFGLYFTFWDRLLGTQNLDRE